MKKSNQDALNNDDLYGDGNGSWIAREKLLSMLQKRIRPRVTKWVTEEEIVMTEKMRSFLRSGSHTLRNYLFDDLGDRVECRIDFISLDAWIEGFNPLKIPEKALNTELKRIHEFMRYLQIDYIQFLID